MCFRHSTFLSYLFDLIIQRAHVFIYTMTCNVRHKHTVPMTTTAVSGEVASTKTRITKAKAKKKVLSWNSSKTNRRKKRNCPYEITKTSIEWKRNWLHDWSGLSTSGNKVGHLIRGVKICIKSCHHTWVAPRLRSNLISSRMPACVYVYLWLGVCVSVCMCTWNTPTLAIKMAFCVHFTHTFTN